MGPGGDGRGRGRSLSSCGVGGRNDDPRSRGVRKSRGGRGGFGGRGNSHRHDVLPAVPMENPEKDDRLEEKIPNPPSVVDETKQSSKKGKKRGKVKEVLTVDSKQQFRPDPEEKMVTKKTLRTVPSPSSSPAPASQEQSSPAPEQPPPVFASQDVRFKQNSTTATPAKSPKSSTGFKNQTQKKMFDPPKAPQPIISEAATNEKVLDASLTGSKFPMSHYTSHATGLKVLSVTSFYPGYVFTTSDRAKLVRTIPGVVIINTAAKGDSLIMGVDIEDEKLATMIPDMEKEKSWTISFVDTTDRDVFSYFKGWKVIPRVDKSGMFQLIVNLKGQGWRSRDEELKKRNQLLELVKDYNIAKVVHGEGETILLVGHVLEMVSYSDTIRKVFSMERRHTWQPRPSAFSESPPSSGQERHFWVKVKCPEMTNLSTAHKQYSVYHELSSAGKVLQLEYLLFGVVDNYLVVFKDIDDMKTLGQNFLLLEIWPDSLPDLYTPTYGVDDCGFYSVSGSFPPNLDTDTRNRFAEDMKMIGAVGFRSGDVEDSFSLHFVNSRCLEQISRCAQFTSFRLTILSSLVRKPGLDKKLRRLVPAIIKYKELQMAAKVRTKESPEADVEIGKPDMQGGNLRKVEVNSNEDVKIKMKMKEKVQLGSLDKLREKAIDVVNEVSAEKAEEVSVKKSKVKSKNIEAKKVVEMSQVVVQSIASSVELDEVSIMKICWKEGVSLSSCLKNLSKFFGMVQDVVVTETEVGNGEVLFKFPSKKKVDEVLNILSDDATNTVDNLKMTAPRVEMNGSKFFKNKFGLVIYDKSSTIAKLKKDFAKFGPLEIEARSRVFVLWFESKLSLFKALANHRRLGHIVVPSVQNFRLSSIEANHILDQTLEVTMKKVVDEYESVDVELVSAEEPMTFKLTEREIFGLIWQRRPKGKKTIRDVQVISRQVTNFIKNVCCQGLTVDEDGLVVVFSTQDDLTTALTQFCPSPVPGTEQLEALARKFTILPARGGFGLFSAKRIKPEHLDRFGDCKVRNCGIWFVDKLAMFKVLRDPFISKTYPALFIDCRNVFILTSKSTLLAAKATDHEKEAVEPAATGHEKKAAKTTTDEKTGVKHLAHEETAAKPTAHKKNTVAKPATREKIIAKDASHEQSSTKPTTCEDILAKPTSREEIISKLTAQEKPVDSSLKPKCLGVMTRSAAAKQTPSTQNAKQGKKQPISVQPSKSSVPTDAAIVTAVASSVTVAEFSTPCPLLSTLLAPDQPGQFGHIPSGRMVRTGYKQSRMPAMARGGAVADLYLDDKDCYRGKDVKEAADLISNIVQGKMTKVTGDTLREIKMKRVESFLKDKLGLEGQLPGQQILKEGTVEGKVDNFTKLMEPIVEACKEDELKKFHEKENVTEVDNIVVEESSINCSKVENSLALAVKKASKASFEKLINVEKKDDFTKLDGEHSKQRVVPSASLKQLQTSPDPVPSTPSLESDGTDVKLSVDIAAKLTPDVIGLFTLTLPVSPGSDLTLLSSLQDDISWFDTPVSIMCMENIEVGGVALIEVKLRDKDMAMAVMTGLKHKYPGLEGDSTGSHADILPDEETGLYTLCFTDTKRKRYKGTMEKFRGYSKSKQLPVISRGLGAEQVLVGFHVKEEAVQAFRENLDSEEFPELNVAPASRG